MEDCLSERINNCRNRRDLERGASGQWMTEQSKNRKRQDKVIKDRPVEGEERAWVWRNETGLDRTRWERTGLSHHYGNRECRAARPRWLTQMHFQWNMECHSVPQGADYQSKVRKYTLHFIWLWISFRPVLLLDSRKWSCPQSCWNIQLPVTNCLCQSPEPLSFWCCTCQGLPFKCGTYVLIMTTSGLSLEIHSSSWSSWSLISER